MPADAPVVYSASCEMPLGFYDNCTQRATGTEPPFFCPEHAPARLLDDAIHDAGGVCPDAVQQLKSMTPACIHSLLCGTDNTALMFAALYGTDWDDVTSECKWYYMTAIAKNPSAPSSLLHVLSTVSSAMMKSDLASNPNTPITILHRYLCSQYLNQFAVMNPSISWETVHEHLSDQWLWEPQIVVNACQRPDAETGIIEEIINADRTASPPPSVLQRLAAECKQPKILLYLARRYIASADPGLQYMRFPHGLLKPLIDNPALPEDAWLCLAESDNQQDLTQIATHVNTPSGVLRCLVEHDWGIVRLAVAQRPDCPHDLLKDLACDPDEDVRVHVSTHGNTNTNTLHILMLDGEPMVSATAARALRIRINRSPEAVS